MNGAPRGAMLQRELGLLGAVTTGLGAQLNLLLGLSRVLLAMGRHGDMPFSRPVCINPAPRPALP